MNYHNLKKERVCVLGFGIQGKAQALNLRDSGHDVVIGNINDRYKKGANKLGFKVLSISKAVKISKIILILIPDGVQDQIIKEQIFPNCIKGATLIFAHGYWLRFESKNIPENLNILMIAPRYPGKQIRDEFLNSSGVPAFVDIIQDYTKDASKILKMLTLSLGFKKGGLISISFKEEAEIDLYIEQFMAPLFFASVEQSFAYLIKKGYSKEAVCMELYFSGELGAVRTMMGKHGLYKTLKSNASPTCQFGISSSRDRVWTHNLDKKMRSQLKRIKSGKFSKELSNLKNSEETIKKFLNSKISNSIIKTEKQLLKKLYKPER